MKATEIQTRINQVRNNLNTNKSKLDQLRVERARLAIADSRKHKATIARFDSQIEDCRKDVTNAPVELQLLEGQLIEARTKEAQAERNTFLKQQKKIAKDAEALSEDFVNTLSRAVDLNEQLQAALTAEAAIAQKTGAHPLEQYCHGSADSLRMLLETMQYQMSGVHTAMVGAGVVGSNVPIRL